MKMGSRGFIISLDRSVNKLTKPNAKTLPRKGLRPSVRTSCSLLLMFWFAACWWRSDRMHNKGLQGGKQKTEQASEVIACTRLVFRG